MKRFLLNLLGVKTQCGFCGRKTKKRWPWRGLPRGWRHECVETVAVFVGGGPGDEFDYRDVHKIRCRGCEK